ncbi:Endoplasmic reticulum protein EP58, contains filamin rod domain and KDEL motif [Phaffia rhodozyma]|uniref:Endoplasmic reticulum protein EP58, contains filamin rod domain and KDEL motif n=1 Tax=Phaffia rhodozyma TaxID=264483 RepID=A0A0F7SFS6_PHARH|nr:Endoplasmic reticulum protein EP58, contains filamin rod domain and KDEL motif [Phaffia rhodozyma]
MSPRTLKPKTVASRAKPVVFLLGAAALIFVFGGFLKHKGRLEAFPSHETLRQYYAPYADKPIVHPIPILMEKAEIKYNKMIASQSKTLAEAVKTYKQRYHRDPPLGFDDWYEFATANGATIIDEYDQMIADLRPYWLLTGEEIRRRSQQVGTLPSVDIVRIQDGQAKAIEADTGLENSEAGARANGFILMLEKFQEKLPDMDFPINEKAEGRVLVPWEQNQYANLTVDSSKGIKSVLGGEFIPSWQGDGGSVWEAFRRTCHPSSQARRLFGSIRTPLNDGQQKSFNYLVAAGVARQETGEDFVFSESVDDKYDFCDYPWAHFDQGHFFSDWRVIDSLYPMFSPAKGLGFSDIIIPTHYYYSSTKRYTYGWDPVNMRIKDFDDMDVPWEKKTDKIFWRGATTGGGASPPGYLSRYQRHRLVRMSTDGSDVNRTVVVPVSHSSKKYVEVTVPVDELNEDMMDFAFVKAVGCTSYPGGCDGLRKDHRFADGVSLGENWKHKYLIDVDGMGYSARLFALLMSKSAVMKTTVYREFFSDWIQPWLHYIPVSSDYQEIYNIHAYFSGPSASTSKKLANGTTPIATGTHDDSELRKIAMEGRKWKMTNGRKVDMEIYVYRLALEWARLVADQRSSRTYQG